MTRIERVGIYAMFDGHCAYCGCDLPEKGWHADHVEPVMREWWKAHRAKTTTKWDGEKVIVVQQDRKVTMSRPERDCIENFMPSCAPCNIDKSCSSLEDWRRSLEQKVRVLRDNYSAYRHAERFGLVVQAETKVVFYFERVRAAAFEEIQG